MMALIYSQQCYTRVAAVSAQANLRQQVKRSGRSQNCQVQKGLPA
jgi:hypothetical protein